MHDMVSRRGGAAAAGSDSAATVVQGELDGGEDALWLFGIEDGRELWCPLPAEGSLVIGRSDRADFVVKSPLVSREHVCVHVGSDRAITVEDLGSANGTRLGEERLPPRQPTPWRSDSVLHVGSTIIILRPRAQELSPTPLVNGPPVTVPAPSGVVLRDPAMCKLYALIGRVAPGDIAVLILGETGVGKEVVANAIHESSRRRGKPFVRLNCAMLSEPLLESELFGHEPGAFTGAVRAKPGLFETAHTGTVFLDEMGELSLPLQAKLLRVLEAREVRRIGGLGTKVVDVRFIAATNRNLEQEVRAGRFREDLYFRLKGISVTVPPLRERPSEIEPLVRHFMDKSAVSMARERAPLLSAASLAALRAHSWPGNVRELKNVIEAAVLLADDVIEPEHLRLDSPRELPSDTVAVAAGSEDDERVRILQALAACAGNQSRAAEMLGMPRRTFVKRLSQYGLPRPRVR